MIEDVPQSKLDNNINFRNIIINGDMSIAQRGTSTSSVSTTQYPSLDRFQMYTQTAGSAVFTVSQDTDVPSGQGFSKSHKIDVTTALGTYGASNFSILRQRIEGQMLGYLKKGTSNAESLTLSFWVKSNKTGTYIAEIYDNDNSRQISKSYTISSSNTWEKKTITFAGDTSGSLTLDNSVSIDLDLYLSAGSNYTSGTLNTSWNSVTTANRAVGQVNLADSTSNEWYITGVQLEAGTTASDFEFLPTDVNLQRCQRYYQLLAQGVQISLAPATYYTSSQIYCNFTTKVPMRTTPTLDIVTGSNYYVAYRNGGSNNFTSFALDKANNLSFELKNTTEASGTGGQSSFIRTSNSSAYIAITAEL
jgi:hypothetical protein